ncbi:MAG: Crp/Fnr family transcriptional regulator [Magnetococcales bacterium]|nr:Crp/Fnr family transcriptional regulator [Magnetococcales bacterium]
MATLEADEMVLKKSSLFSALSKEQFEEVRRGMRVIQLQSGENLFDMGTPADHFYILVLGQIKLFRLSSNGTEKIVEIVRPSESFATAVMFMEVKRYPLAADALKKSRVLAFDNKQLLDILRQSPETCFRMMANMSRRLRWQLTEIDKLSLQTAPGRLVAFLLDHVKPIGNASGAGQVNLDSPKRVLASRLSIQPETFSRILKKLSSKDLIQVKGQVICIPNIQALALHAEEGI